VDGRLTKKEAGMERGEDTEAKGRRNSELSSTTTRQRKKRQAS